MLQGITLSSITQLLLLLELNWYFWIQFKVIYTTYKALNHLSTVYLKDHLALQISEQPLQSSDGGLFQIPPVKEVRLVGTQEKGLLCGSLKS